MMRGGRRFRGGARRRERGVESWIEVAAIEGEGEDLGAGDVGLDVGYSGLEERGVGGDGDGFGGGAGGEDKVGGGGFAYGDGDAFAVQMGEGGGGDVYCVGAWVKVGEEIEAGRGGLGGLAGALGGAGEGDGGLGDGSAGWRRRCGPRRVALIWAWRVGVVRRRAAGIRRRWCLNTRTPKVVRLLASRCGAFGRWFGALVLLGPRWGLLEGEVVARFGCRIDSIWLET